MEKTDNYKSGYIWHFAKNLIRIFAIIWKEQKVILFGIFIVSIFIALVPFGQSGSHAYFVNQLIRIAESHILDNTFFISLLFVVTATAVPGFLYLLQDFFQKRFYFFVGEKFELLILAHRALLDVGQYENPKFNNLLNKVNEKGVWVIQNMANDIFYNFQSAIAVIVSSFIIARYSLLVFGIILVTSIPVLIISTKYSQESWFIWSDGVSAEQRRKFWETRQHFSFLPRLVELKLFQNVKTFMMTLGDMLRIFFLKQKKNETKRTVMQLIANVFSVGAFVYGIVFFVSQVVQGDISVGSFLFVTASIGSFQNSLSGFFSSIGRQYENHLYIADLFEFLDTPAELEKKRGAIVLSDKTPEIIFKNISFKYPETDKYVFKNFNLTIKSGEKIALIGLNGAGKTTLVKLLCRFYDLDEGEILLDGINLREIDLESWYKKLGVLFQEYAQYKLKVKDAIALGKSDREFSLDLVHDSAKKAEADEFIKEWPHGYDQQLSKEYTEGVEPSIGQWQKLAIARVFYRDPEIWILDEPTSSIDADAEAKIFGKLAQLPSNRTAILISHRFSTVRNANTICVISEGNVLELGTHEELIEKKGEYFRLFTIQAKGYK